MKNKSLFALMALGLALPVTSLQAQNEEPAPQRDELRQDQDHRPDRPDRPQRFERRERRVERLEKADRPEMPGRPGRPQDILHGPGPGPDHSEQGPGIQRRERLHRSENFDRPAPEGHPGRPGPMGSRPGQGPGFRGPGGGQHPPLFALLDRNGDGRLNQRELDQAGRALRRLDRNRDGEVTMNELHDARLGRGPQPEPRKRGQDDRRPRDSRERGPRN